MRPHDPPSTLLHTSGRQEGQGGKRGKKDINSGNINRNVERRINDNG